MKSNLPIIVVESEAANRMDESMRFSPDTQYASKSDLQRDIDDPRYRQAYFQKLVQEKLARSPQVYTGEYVPTLSPQLRTLRESDNPGHKGDKRSIGEMLEEGVTPNSYAREWEAQNNPKSSGLSVIEMLSSEGT
jgi:hypothetical protein